MSCLSVVALGLLQRCQLMNSAAHRRREAEQSDSGYWTTKNTSLCFVACNCSTRREPHVQDVVSIIGCLLARSLLAILKQAVCDRTLNALQSCIPHAGADVPVLLIQDVSTRAPTGCTEVRKPSLEPCCSQLLAFSAGFGLLTQRQARLVCRPGQLLKWLHKPRVAP